MVVGPDQPVVQGTIAILIVVFLIILVWSRMQQQKISETIMEIRDILKGQA